MKWIEERDALIAQTKAFVEAVARRSADTGRSGARPVTRPVPRDAVVPSSVQSRRRPRSSKRHARLPANRRPLGLTAVRPGQHDDRNPRANRSVPRTSGALQPGAPRIFQRDAGKAACGDRRTATGGRRTGWRCRRPTSRQHAVPDAGGRRPAPQDAALRA